MKPYTVAGLLGVCAALFALSAQAATKIENFAESYRQKCDFVTNAFYGDDWCNPGNATARAPNVVLVGDSYSNSLVGVLEEHASLGGKGLIYEQYGRGQCPALLGYGPDWCSAFAQTAYERIKKTPSIKTVMLAANWSYYWAEQKQFSATGRPYLRAEYEKSFVATLKAYRALGKAVVVVYQSPGIDDPKVCVSRRFQPASVANQCALSRQQADARETYRQFMSPVLQQLKVKSLDPYAYFCNAKECTLKDGDKIFITTATHLSGFGGQYLARKAKPDLQKLLQF